MNYKTRIISFLQENPNIRMTPGMLASYWKRNRDDVALAAVELIHSGKVVEDQNGFLHMNTCEGIGGA